MIEISHVITHSNVNQLICMKGIGRNCVLKLIVLAGDRAEPHKMN